MSKAQSKKELDEVVNIIANTNEQERNIINEYVHKIVSAAILFSHLGVKFTFASNDNLDKKVNYMLVQCSDDIKALIEKAASTALLQIKDISDEDIQSALDYVNRENNGSTITDRLDEYASNMKYMLEAYIAAGMAENASANEIANQYIMWMNNPYSSPMMRNAAKHRFDFVAPLILSLGYTLGSGRYISPVANTKRITTYSIAEGYNYAKLEIFRRDSRIIGYRTFRNSSFPCEVCDELTKTIHPLTDLVLPAHPACICGMYEVYANSERTPESPLPEDVKIRRKMIREQAKHLTAQTFYNTEFPKPIKISNKGIKEWLNQPHEQYAEKNESLLQIDSIIKNAKYLGYGIDVHDNTITAHLFETTINNVKSWIIIREIYSAGCLIHSISDNKDIVNKITAKK